MDAFDLDPHLLTAAFTIQTITLPIVQDLTEWVRNTTPSINLLTSIFNEHLACKQFLFLKTTLFSVSMVITKLQEFKCPKIIIRAYLAVIKANRTLLKDFYSKKELVANWAYINVDLLEYYCSTFDILIYKRQIDRLQIDISQSQVKARIEQLIESKQYDNAINLIKIINYPEQLLKMLFKKMNNSKQASKAANLMKTHKINPQMFKSIGQRLNKNTVRYFFKNHGWEVVEQIFENNIEALACLVQDLVYKEKTKQAITVWYRHKAVENKIKNIQTLQLLKIYQNKDQKDLQNQILQNSLHKDYFGPFDSSKYLTLQELGITKQKIIWINIDSPQIDDLINSLNAQQQMSIDTESIVGKNKLDHKVQEQGSIIQIAFSDKVYILDGLNCKDIRIKNGISHFIESRKLVLGHALQNDINGLLLSVGFTNLQIRALKMTNTVDTCKLFKIIYPDEKYSNLAYISKRILGKQVCKKQTMTNWARRPLRDNQIHYAAMDAFVVLKIFQKLKQEVGEGIMEYFLDLDE